MQAYKIFIISLPERKEDRLDLLTAKLGELLLEYTVIHAIKDEIGARGLVLTMQKLLQYCVNERLDNALILEDDALFIENPDLIEKCIEQLPGDFHLLYLGGYMPYAHKKLYSDNLIQLSMMYSTHAIYYSREAMIKILEQLDDTIHRGYTRPYDQLLCNGIQKEKRCYCTYPMIMKQRSGYSDIQKDQVDYKKWHEDKFKEMTAGLS